ncbi:hypothetical protein L839_2453 [Mycobacterium avium MAV_120809_2495]|nr:hypothetical protein L839_2453 [Mycobacterium avium MAV_120809_2495]
MAVEPMLDDQRSRGAQQRTHDRIRAALAGNQEDGRPHRPPYW